jgi:hypothetical protein
MEGAGVGKVYTRNNFGKKVSFKKRAKWNGPNLMREKEDPLNCTMLKMSEKVNMLLSELLFSLICLYYM